MKHKKDSIDQLNEIGDKIIRILEKPSSNGNSKIYNILERFSKWLDTKL